MIAEGVRLDDFPRAACAAANPKDRRSPLMVYVGRGCGRTGVVSRHPSVAAAAPRSDPSCPVSPASPSTHGRALASLRVALRVALRVGLQPSAFAPAFASPFFAFALQERHGYSFKSDDDRRSVMARPAIATYAGRYHNGARHAARSAASIRYPASTEPSSRRRSRIFRERVVGQRIGARHDWPADEGSGHRFDWPPLRSIQSDLSSFATARSLRNRSGDENPESTVRRPLPARLSRPARATRFDSPATAWRSATRDLPRTRRPAHRRSHDLRDDVLVDSIGPPLRQIQIPDPNP